jgi:predicted amidohydrolase
MLALVAGWTVLLLILPQLVASASAATSAGTNGAHTTAEISMYATAAAVLPRRIDDAPPGAEGGNLTIAMLQLPPVRRSLSSMSNALAAALSEAVTEGAELAVTPEAWMTAETAKGVTDAVSSLARAHTIAVAVGFVLTREVAPQSYLVVIDRTGSLLVTHSKPRDTAAEPLASKGFPPVVSLPTRSGYNISVGLLIGHEILFPEISRLLMLGGAELILAPLSHKLAHLSPTDELGSINVQRVCQTRAFENVAAVACVEPASAPGENLTSRLEILGSISMTPSFVDFDDKRSPVFVAIVPISAIRTRRLGHTIWGDAYRRPYDYRELCGIVPVASAPTLAVSLTQGENTGDPDAENLVVGILQMQASNISLQENVAKATSFARRAKARGADVVIFPEMWSTGYASFFPSAGPYNDSALFEWMDTSTPLDGDYISHFRNLAVELNMAIGAAYLEQNEGGAAPPRNSVAMIDRHGR